MNSAPPTADPIFAALQGIPGGPAATVRDSEGNLLRVLSPLQSSAYPDLGEYVRSMAGKPIALHSTFSGPNPGELSTSAYTGTFAADGSIALTGTTDGPQTAPGEITIPGDELIEDVYTGKGTPNNFEGQIRHDVLVGFMAGYWDGNYGNDALDFCNPANRNTAGPQPYCDTGFNQPAFGAARPGLSPFPTCEQYAAVINQYADMYGNPYSDGASGSVTIPIVKSGSNDVKTLQLTILPDSGSAQPVSGGNSNCGAGSVSSGSGAVPISGQKRHRPSPRRRPHHAAREGTAAARQAAGRPRRLLSRLWPCPRGGQEGQAGPRPGLPQARGPQVPRRRPPDQARPRAAAPPPAAEGQARPLGRPDRPTRHPPPPHAAAGPLGLDGGGA